MISETNDSYSPSPSTNICCTIIIIGAATLDRILYVQKYPDADTKSSCDRTVQCGGGNAANTASGVARLGLTHSNFRAQLLTKMSNDKDGEALVSELEDYGVDLTSPLFLYGPGRPPVVTVIVTNETPFTRTCIFDPGTVGTLTLSDLDEHYDLNPSGNKVPPHAIYEDEFWEGVRHFHSDTRHTEVAAFLAKRARQRDIPVSVDVERDRYTADFDELVDLATIVFTNEELMKSIVQRRKGSGAETDRDSVKTDILRDDEQLDRVEKARYYSTHSLSFYHNVVCLCHSLSELKVDSHPVSTKQLVVTRGDKGAILCVRESTIDRYSKVKSGVCTRKEKWTKVLSLSDNIVRISYTTKEEISSQECTDQFEGVGEVSLRCIETIYTLYIVGPPKNISIICDTTGSGDAFIAGYIFCEMIWKRELEDGLSLLEAALFRLRFASWVAGNKIGGVGARETLPTFNDVTNELGSDMKSIAQTLEAKVAKSIL